jgi:hypothetical protein
MENSLFKLHLHTGAMSRVSAPRSTWIDARVRRCAYTADGNSEAGERVGGAHRQRRGIICGRRHLKRSRGMDESLIRLATTL